MLRIQSHPSPNKDARPIPIEFVVLHYTACSLSTTLKILSAPTPGVSSHLVLDEDGTVYELVPCFGQTVERARHSGKSEWTDSTGKQWSGFNDFSIGIEIVNRNGNLFPFTEAQYQALCLIIAKLKELHPPLSSPERIIGHEQIAGFRGKSDPGECFDWGRIFRECYPNSTTPKREPRLPRSTIQNFQSRVEMDAKTKLLADEYWMALSTEMESIQVGELLK